MCRCLWNALTLVKIAFPCAWSLCIFVLCPENLQGLFVEELKWTFLVIASNLFFVIKACTAAPVTYHLSAQRRLKRCIAARCTRLFDVVQSVFFVVAFDRHVVVDWLMWLSRVSWLSICELFQWRDINSVGVPYAGHFVGNEILKVSRVKYSQVRILPSWWISVTPLWYFNSSIFSTAVRLVVDPADIYRIRQALHQYTNYLS